MTALPALEAARETLDAAIADTLRPLPKGELSDAMRYGTIGGKRMRGFLVLESAALHDIDAAAAMPAAVAVELLHAYSLIHDDLPAMDDDDLRRGMPTAHIQWSEATAILAGDALQSLAFECLADPAIGAAEARLRLISSFAQAVGPRGMVLGQMLDIAAETAPEPLDLTGITRLQAAKTGALISFSAQAGALMADADPGPLMAYADALGLAFQIADDILDVTGDEAVTGKRVGKDAEAGKATFPALLGLEGAQNRAAELVSDAQAALEPYGDRAQNLRDLAQFVISRQS